MSRIQSIKPGELLPEREFKPDNVQLFLYNSALWNAHRIHFDLPYTKEVEGYPGLVIAGPLLGDWLTQSVTEWLGEHGVLTSIEYANRKASYVGEVLRSGGKVIYSEQDTGLVTLDLYIKDETDETTTTGVATVRFSPPHASTQ